MNAGKKHALLSTIAAAGFACTANLRDNIQPDRLLRDAPNDQTSSGDFNLPEIKVSPSASGDLSAFAAGNAGDQAAGPAGKFAYGDGPVKWVVVTGSWRKTGPQIEEDVRREVRGIIAQGKGIITGGATGVDYFAADEALKLNPAATRIRVFLPSTLELYTDEYRKYADEGQIPREQVEALVRQLNGLKTANPAALIEDKTNAAIDQQGYYLRDSKEVEAADELVAFQVNRSLGTQDTIDKAEKKGIPVRRFAYTVDDALKWVVVTGTWRKTGPQVEDDVRREVRRIFARGKGLVAGGALGVDYFATDEALKLNPAATQIRVFLPSTLELYAAHYRRRAGEGVITREQAESLIGQLTRLKNANPAALIEDKTNAVIDQRAYYLRDSKEVEAADELVAFQVNQSSGTQDTVNKAEKKGIPVKKFVYSIR